MNRMLFKKVIKSLFIICFIISAFTASAQNDKKLTETAVKLYDDKKYDEAIEACGKALSVNPQNSWTLNILGLCYAGKKQYDQAIVNYSEAIRLSPKYLGPIINRANSYNALKQYDLAIKDFDQAINLEATAANYYNRGNFYSNRKEFELAIADFDNALKVDPKFKKAFLSKGYAYNSKGLYKLALKEINAAIGIDPTDYNGYMQRGFVYDKMGEYDLAIKEYYEAMRVEPNYAFPYIGSGTSYKLMGKYDLALQEFQKVVQDGKYISLAYMNIVLVLAHTREFAKIKETVDQFKKADPVSAERYLNKDGNYRHIVISILDGILQNDYQTALKYLDLDIEKLITNKEYQDYKEDFMDLHSLKGFVLEKLNRTDEAIEIYKQSLVVHSIQPDVSAALLKLEKKTGIKDQENIPKPIAQVADRVPPTIVITSPTVTRGLKVVQKTKLLTVKGSAKDASGIYEVMVNGVEANLDGAGNFSANVPLVIGDNQLLVTATDAKMNKGSFNFTITRPAVDVIQPNETPIIAITKADINPEGKFYALIIGVEDYTDESINDLDMPVTDANSLYQTLTSKYTFDRENVSLLKNPTRDQLFESLESLSRQVKSSDNLLIFYAGHGYWDASRSQGYWFPSDARRLNRSSWLTNADLKEYINAIKSKHTLLISDACFSGGIFKSRAVMAGASRAVRELYDLPSRKAMTSGTLKEVPDKSVFIEYLVKRLNQNIEKYLSAEQLFSSFRTAVINNSANGQVPQFGEIKEAGDEGGDFIFIRK